MFDNLTDLREDLAYSILKNKQKVTKLEFELVQKSQISFLPQELLKFSHIELITLFIILEAGSVALRHQEL